MRHEQVALWVLLDTLKHEAIILGGCYLTSRNKASEWILSVNSAGIPREPEREDLFVQHPVYQILPNSQFKCRTV